METGIGLTHAITDRISSQLSDLKKRSLSPLWRAGIAAFITIVSVMFAQVGIIGLVANYYSVMGVTRPPRL